MRHFPDLPPLVTPQEAERVWNSHRCPSVRSVAKAMSQAGRPVHFTTVARWRRQGWRTVASPAHPLETAGRAVHAASSVLEGDRAVTKRNWIRHEGVSQELTSDSEILARAVRLTSIASILLMEEFVLRSNVIGGTRPHVTHEVEMSLGQPRVSIRGGCAWSAASWPEFERDKHGSCIPASNISRCCAAA
jgi:hypothetical protein